MPIADFRCLAGDAQDAARYEELLGGERADLLLTDPPYCLLTRRRAGGDLRDPKNRKIDRDPVLRFEDVRTYRRFTEGWMRAVAPHLRPEAPLVIWTNFLGAEPIRTVARSLGYGHLRGEFTWAKRTTESRGNEQLLRVYEIALVLGREPQSPLDAAARSAPWAIVAGYDDEGEGTRWGDHPHHKPFRVIEPLVREYSKPGGLVLDPFAGSGSIPVAARRLQRRTACLELVPEWAERVSARLREEQR
jgi:site-specific DNA-methyltransferase (adenine-specific)